MQVFETEYSNLIIYYKSSKDSLRVANSSQMGEYLLDKLKNQLHFLRFDIKN